MKLRRDTLAEQVSRGLMEIIEVRNLKPGDLLPSVGTLVEEFGVSRPIVREALASLEAQDIIEVANGKRATLRPVTSGPLNGYFEWATRMDRNTLVELLEVRRGIETQAAIFAAERRTPRELEGLRNLLNAMRRKLQEPDAYAELDTRFHLAIASATHNAMIGHLVESIRGPLKDTIREGLRHKYTDEGRERVQQRHESILVAIERGDAEDAREAMSVHFDGAIATARSVLDAETLGAE